MASASRSALAAGAVEARAGTLHDPPDRPPAHPAGFARPVVHEVSVLKVAGRAVGAHEVAERAAPRRERVLERRPQRDGESIAAIEREAACGCPGVDAGAKQALVRVDVSHARDEPVVHEELLDRDAPPASRRMETPTRECARKRLHPEMGEEWVTCGVADVPE